MQTNRRTIIIGAIANIAFPIRVFGKPSASVWVEVAKVLGDVGESLATFSSSVGKIDDDVIRGHDRIKRRSVRASLIKTSVKLSSLIADQERVQRELDQYGDLWRKFHQKHHTLSPSERASLDLQWRRSITTIRSIASATTAILNEIRTFDSDIALEESYINLQEALSAKVGILDGLARTPAPSNPSELRQLVNDEETFLHLRAEARGALEAVNQAIRAIPT